MAVVRVSGIERYEGTAAEIAAFDLTGIPAGSTFLETDNGIIKVLDQAGALQPKYEQVKIAAGTSIVGKVGIDQTTPGTTNGVQVNAALPAGTNLVGKFGIDQATANANEVVVKSITAGSNVIGKVAVTDTGVCVTGSQTRPDKTTAYDAGDIVGTDAATNGTLASIGSANQVIRITGLKLVIRKAATDLATTAGSTSGYYVHFFTSEPTAITDNSARAVGIADVAKHARKTTALAKAMEDLGDFLSVEATDVNLDIKLASTSLYYWLETVAGYTPVAETVQELTAYAVPL
jgi:hypothetical protein